MTALSDSRPGTAVRAPTGRPVPARSDPSLPPRGRVPHAPREGRRARAHLRQPAGLRPSPRAATRTLQPDPGGPRPPPRRLPGRYVPALSQRTAVIPVPPARGPAPRPAAGGMGDLAGSGAPSFRAHTEPSQPRPSLDAFDRPRDQACTPRRAPSPRSAIPSHPASPSLPSCRPLPANHAPRFDRSFVQPRKNHPPGHHPRRVVPVHHQLIDDLPDQMSRHLQLPLRRVCRH